MSSRLIFFSILLSACLAQQACQYTLLGVQKNFPHGATAYKECGVNQTGFKKLTCDNAVVTEDDIKCLPKVATLFSYGIETITLKKGIAMTAMNAIKDSSLKTFTSLPALPAGIILNPTTGAISGTTTANAQSKVSYTITASDDVNVNLKVVINISITVNQCAAMSGFPLTDAGVIASSSTACPEGFVGTALLQCAANGKWTGAIDITSCTVAALASFSYPTTINTRRNEAANSSPSYTAVPSTITVSFSVTSGTLPNGLTISTTTGVVAGVALAKASTSVIITARTAYLTQFATVAVTLPIVVTDSSCVGMVTESGASATTTNNNELPFACPSGYTGTSGMVCMDGVYQLMDISKCIPSKPTDFFYASPRFIFYVGDNVTTSVPVYKNPVTSFKVDKALPLGLNINVVTGEISGTPTTASPETSYVVSAQNSVNSSPVTVLMSVRLPVCDPVEEQPETGYSNTAKEYKCEQYRKNDDSLKLKYTGVVKRTCELVDNRGQWKVAESYCVQDTDFLLLYIGIAIFVVAVIVLVVVLLMRNSGNRNGNKKLPISKSSGKPAAKNSGSKAGSAKTANIVV